MNSRIYFDYLDSLRFFAFLIVFIAHAGILFPISANWFYWIYRNVISHGAYGVNFFFVLSGFLITFLLLKEKKETKKIDLKFFYFKRFLRIWPVYFMVFFISIFILPFIVRMFEAEHVFGSTTTFVNMNMTTSSTSAWLFAFFIGNFSLAHDLGAIPFALGVLWSVSVEEQFYVIWPMFAKYCTTRILLLVSVFLFFISLAYRAFYINDANIAYYSTFSVTMDLASGCILGILYYIYARNIQRFTLLDLKNIVIDKAKRSIICKKTYTFYILLFIIILIWLVNIYIFLQNGDGMMYDFLRLMKRPVLDAFFVYVLMFFIYRGIQKNRITAAKTNLFSKQMELALIDGDKQIGLRYKPFTYLGRISYGLYAYHTIVIVLVLMIFNYFGTGPNNVSIMIFLSIFIISFVGTIFISHISYQFMEKRILGLRERYKK